jgi:alpha-L-fucosidase 2
MADSLGKEEEAEHWQAILNQWPSLARSKEDGGLLVAPDTPLHASHRHFSHLMAFHPLGLVDISNSDEDVQTIEHSLEKLEELGPDWWCGYSYAWVGGLYARARQADNAVKALRTFAECFTSINSFHLNGDQSKTGKSKFQYRPFTLEGNFAFAASIQEMLLQSHTGTVVVFPSIPQDWHDASFQTLRTEGAFLISARKEHGIITEIDITSEVGETLRIQIPSTKEGHYEFHGTDSDRIVYEGDVAVINTKSAENFSLHFRPDH